MPKLTKRQWIILSVMVAAILYGAYDFLLAPKQKSSATDVKAKLAQLGTFMADVTVSMAGGALSAADAYIVSRAETEWKRDPFYEKKSFREWMNLKNPMKAGVSSIGKANFVYSGYLNLDNKRIAIVNDVEYGAGDTLETGGFVLKQIYPDRVVIVNERDGTKFEVLLQD